MRGAAAVRGDPLLQHWCQGGGCRLRCCSEGKLLLCSGAVASGVSKRRQALRIVARVVTTQKDEPEWSSKMKREPFGSRFKDAADSNW